MIPDKVQRIIQILNEAGARDVVIVGGFVRDHFINVVSKDVDIEVFGLDLHSIEVALSRHFNVNMVGRAFGVVKVDNEIDVSVPRRENKVGVGHRGFDVEVDPNMSFEEAAARRDFTINAMGMRADGKILDPFNGQEDFRNRVLRHTSDKFGEDPLRVLRAMQFAGRFFFSLHPDTARICQGLGSEFHTLPKERIWEEWKKWALRSIKPSAGLKAMLASDWLRFFPAIHLMMGVVQDEEWHPEGDVFIHTMHVVDAAAKIAIREKLSDEDRIVLMFAALGHDFGKPKVTEWIDGRWRSPGHAGAGADLVDEFLESIGAPKSVAENVKPLVVEHLAHIAVKSPNPRIVRRLAQRLLPSNVAMWAMLVEADVSGRPPLPAHNPVADWVRLAEDLDVDNGGPSAILMGRHLIEMGVPPGKAMGNLLAAAFEAQLEGAFDNLDDAKRWAEAATTS